MMHDAWMQISASKSERQRDSIRGGIERPSQLFHE